MNNISLAKIQDAVELLYGVDPLPEYITLPYYVWDQVSTDVFARPEIGYDLELRCSHGVVKLRRGPKNIEARVTRLEGLLAR